MSLMVLTVGVEICPNLLPERDDFVRINMFPVLLKSDSSVDNMGTSL